MCYENFNYEAAEDERFDELVDAVVLFGWVFLGLVLACSAGMCALIKLVRWMW